MSDLKSPRNMYFSWHNHRTNISYVHQQRRLEDGVDVRPPHRTRSQPESNETQAVQRTRKLFEIHIFFKTYINVFPNGGSVYSWAKWPFATCCACCYDISSCRSRRDNETKRSSPNSPEQELLGSRHSPDSGDNRTVSEESASTHVALLAYPPSKATKSLICLKLNELTAHGSSSSSSSKTPRSQRWRSWQNTSMFKSTSEQLQIKNKRKTNSSSYSAFARDSCLIHGALQPRLLQQTIEDRRIIVEVDNKIESPSNRVQQRCSSGSDSGSGSSSDSWLRDRRQQHKETEEMPLSQGYSHYHGGRLNNTNNNNNHNNPNNINNCNRFEATTGVKRRWVASGSIHSPDVKRKASSENLQHNAAQLSAKRVTAQLGSSNSSHKTNSGHQLQLSYLLGESLARCGRLHEAFDIYVIIAHEHLEGCIPLDRLNTLATCLISYLKQQQQQHQQQQQQTAKPTDRQKQQQQNYTASANQRGIAWHDSFKGKFTKYASVTLPHRSPPKASAQSAVAAAAATEQTRLGVGAFTLAASAAQQDSAGSLCRTAARDREDSVDPLLCPLCQDILRNPVTTNCGHTFCRQCCEAITMCNICEVTFPRNIASNEREHGANNSRAQKHFNSGANSATNATTTTTTTAAAVEVATNLYSSASSASSSPSSSASASSLLAAGNSFFSASSRQANAVNSSSSSVAYNAVNASISRRSSSGAETGVVTRSTSTTATTTTLTTAPVSSSSSTAAYAMRALRANNERSMKFMPDVLVRRLVEKWWGADLQAKKINETAASYLSLNLLDDALKFCNASLEKSPLNFKSLLLRAEVLRKLNHFQSSLADVESALKTRCTSAKAHYQRALILAELGRLDQALQDYCLAISLDRSSNISMSELFQHDLAKLLQKLLAQVPKQTPAARSTHRRTFATHGGPYGTLSEHRLRRKQIGLLSSSNDDDGDFSFLQPETDESTYDELMAAEELELALVGGMINGYKHPCTSRPIFAHLSQDFELGLQTPNSRKHCRRKWLKQETELMPSGGSLRAAPCSELFRNVLQRTQPEAERLRKLETESAEAQQHEPRELMPVHASLIDASDFDCVLCCRTFWKPVVTPCGHTYCWVCLDRCMDYTSSCPLCMSPLVEPFNINAYPSPGSSSPVPFVLAQRPVTKFLEAAMKRFIPESYARRFRQEIDMEPSVPVFICTAAFPHVPCPLFVYEPRYRLMVRRAVESGEKQFGIVQPHGGKSRYFDVGTILDIRDCVLLGDGCTILSTVGCKRFRILARNEKDGYETAKVEYIYDEAIADEHVAFVAAMHAAVLLKANEWIDSLSDELKQEILQSFGEMPPLEDDWERLADGPAWAWWIIALLPLSQQLKVDILATTSLEKRLRAIEKTLDYMTRSFRQSAQQSCSAVVQQQQLQHHQQQQHCDHELAPTNCQADECCLAAAATAALAPSNDAHASNADHHAAQLLLP